jgi:uncharacterized protein (DUF983 family)
MLLKKNMTTTQALLSCKCPQCHKGNLFTNSGFNLLKFHKMPKQCEYCGLDYEPEPGFYYSAMYISYALNVAMIITVGFGVGILFSPKSFWGYILPVWGVILLTFPFTLRYSRAIAIYFLANVTYDEKAIEKYQKEKEKE